jgi:epoxyqueuosine reductase
VTSGLQDQHQQLEELIKEEARRLGFVLAGVTTPDAPPHLGVFEDWVARGRHGTMGYLAKAQARMCRADPRQLLPECQSIVMLAVPYSKPEIPKSAGQQRGRVAAYAWGQDYHTVLPGRMRSLVAFIEGRVGRHIPSRCFTDSAPILERDLAQRAGLGWIGKNTCLINPKNGSYLLLAEILLGLRLQPDKPFGTDHCGKCTRCIEACPTDCILPDRTLDARRCISYLTIESRDSIPLELRPQVGDWAFGCDICQMVCPWNRFATAEGDAPLRRQGDSSSLPLEEALRLSAEEFAERYRRSPVKRAGHAGYLRNLAVAAGNTAAEDAVPALQQAAEQGGPIVQEHAEWAIKQIAHRAESHG